MIVLRCVKVTIDMMFVFVALLLVGCIGKNDGASTDEAIALLQAASKQKDYDRILELADSLEKGGSLSLGESYYWQGYAYYRLSQNMTAEFYFKESMMELM